MKEQVGGLSHSFRVRMELRDFSPLLSNIHSLHRYRRPAA
jgi:hypothetical protein